MKTPCSLRFATSATLLALSSTAFAQSSVTLYGIVDAGLLYANNQTALGSKASGHSVVKATTGVWAGSRIGFRGNEDLGGGNKVIYVLENGFSSVTGAQLLGGMFGRQAYAGLSNDRFGTLTFGRQYSSYYLALFPYGPTRYLTGAIGAHPGDIDGLDSTYRINNAIQYTSPTWAGLTFGATYGLGGVPGSFAQGQAWSVSGAWHNGPIGVGVAVLKFDNATSNLATWGDASTVRSAGLPGVSAINSGYSSARSQQRVAVAGGYEFTSNVGASLTYSNTQFVPGAGSTFRDTSIFNSFGAVIHYHVAANLDLSAGYDYLAATRANRIQDAARYHEFTLAQSYSLSKRTTLYAVEGYTQASGKTLSAGTAGTAVDAVAVVGDTNNSTPSSSNKQFVMTVGLVTRF